MKGNVSFMPKQSVEQGKLEKLEKKTRVGCHVHTSSSEPT